MTKQQIKKNIILSEKFSRHVMKNPDKFEHVPKNANIVVIPKNDKKLAEINLKMAENVAKKRTIYRADETSNNGWQVSKMNLK